MLNTETETETETACVSFRFPYNALLGIENHDEIRLKDIR